MTPEQLAYWLQGFAELNRTPPTPEQWTSIREHLATVFAKMTSPLVTEDGMLPRRKPLDWAFQSDEVDRVRRIMRHEEPRTRGLRDRLIC